jgi:hypothetical protein
MNHKVGDKFTVCIPVIGCENFIDQVNVALTTPYAFRNQLSEILKKQNIESYQITSIEPNEDKLGINITIIILGCIDDPPLELKINAEELLHFLGDFPVDHSIFNAIIKYLSNKYGLPAENILLEAISESSVGAGLFDSFYNIKYRIIEKSKLNDKKYPKIRGREFYG